MTLAASLSAKLADGLLASLSVSAVVAAALLVKSFKDFSQTGPQLRKQVLDHYRGYAVFAVMRLIAWVFLLCTAMSFLGALAYIFGTIAFPASFQFGWALVAAASGVALFTGLQFCRHLLYLPASIAVSYHYRKSRLYPLWRLLSVARVRWATVGAVAAVCSMPLAAAWKLAANGEVMSATLLLGLVIVGASVAYGLFHDYAPRPKQGTSSKLPNILMIGSDTLRADRLGGAGYSRRLTPFIDALAGRGTVFTACYVPCARTAPSLLSLLTGTWPHTHGVRDNFVADTETRLPVTALPEILAKRGYRTAAVSDWSGGDLRKFRLGFEHLDLPEDQWNIKYLIRQGPKDLRLFLSLFTHNRFGKWALPELYYLAGVPLTSLVGRDARALISRFARDATAILPECLRIDDASTLRFRVPVLHAVVGQGICRGIEIRHGALDRSVGDHPPPGRQQEGVRSRPDHRPVRRLRPELRSRGAAYRRARQGMRSGGEHDRRDLQRSRDGVLRARHVGSGQ